MSRPLAVYWTADTNPFASRFGFPPIYIHLYGTSEQGHRGKEEYEIWEYGDKDVTLILGGNALKFLA